MIDGFAGLRRRALQREIRQSLWFLPSLAVILALVAAELLGRLRVEAATGLLVVGSPDTARTILSTIATATITVVSLTFSITVLALQLAAGQYSPRLLRNFLADRGTQVVLSGLIGTFTYSLLLIRRIQDATGDTQASIPAIGITVAIVLAVLCVGLLVYFVDHVPDQLRVESIMDRVADSTDRAIDGLLDHEPDGREAPEPPEDAGRVTTTVSGHLQSVDLDALAEVAAALGIHVRMRSWVGDFVLAGSTIAWWWQHGDDLVDSDDVVDRVRCTYFVGRDRTLEDDVAFGMRQLVDIAVRAMSPAINDPTTARLVVENLSILLARLVDVPLGDRVAGEHPTTVVLPMPDFAAHLDLAMGQIRRSAAHEPAVVAAMGRSLRDLLEIADRREHVEALLEEVDHLRAAVDAHDLLSGDRGALVRLWDQLDSVVAGRADAEEATAE